MRKQKLLRFWPLPVLLALLALFLDVKFARPETAGVEGDRWIGFHLAYERISSPPEEGEEPVAMAQDRSHWVEYGRQSMDAGAFGSVSIPQMILIGEPQPNGRYLFPGLEGYNAFLPTQEETLEDGSPDYTILTCSDLVDGTSNLNVTDTGSHMYLSGTAYFGPPLDDSKWNTEDSEYVWTAYNVYQMRDGTVYLTGSGNSYGGVGGFSFKKKMEWNDALNGITTDQSSLEVEISIKSIPRTTSATLLQFDIDGRILAQHPLTIPQTDFGQTLEFPRADGAACVLLRQDYADLPPKFSLLDLQENGFYGAALFLDSQGMAFQIPIQVV